MDIVKVASELVNHILTLEEKNPNDKELGTEIRKYVRTFKEMKEEYEAVDAEIKRLINGN